MKKIEKILQYLDSKGISISEFERESGLSNTYLKKTEERGVDISQKMLDRILLKNPAHYKAIFENTSEENLIETKNPGLPKDQDLKDKYISLLEATVREKSELMRKVAASLDQIPGSMNMLTDLILSGQKQIVQQMEENFEALIQKLSEAGGSVRSKKPLQKEKR